MRRWETGVPEGSVRIPVDGVDLAVDDRGAGQPVICLHAIAHGSADFDTFAARAAGRYRVIRIDWPGQGRSGEDGVAPAPARYAALLRGVVVQLGIEDPVIIGCSIGGAAAIEYASRYPVRALVLANPGGLVTPSKTVSRACRAISRFFAAGSRGAWWFGAAYRGYYRLVLPWPHAWRQRQRIVRAGYENAALLAAAWSTFADPRQADQRRAAIDLDVPVLFTWAMHDRINLFRASQATIARMKNARVVKFDGGHAAFLEQPKQFVAVFDRFIAGIAGAARRAPSRPAAAPLALAQ
ncbi:MAG TPA: alpha/beta hydrolase [Bradyrhizobium sp.]|nr:alpha/beta hydrolase [Bradyrhizobium sp.]